MSPRGGSILEEGLPLPAERHREFCVKLGRCMPTILLVDDDEQIRAWLRQVLTAKSYHVEEVCNGDEALDRIKQKSVALIVLDLYMPGRDGLETISGLRSRVPPIKILAISGNPILGFDTCRTAKALGAHDALAKPFDAQTFLQRVEVLLCHS